MQRVLPLLRAGDSPSHPALQGPARHPRRRAQPRRRPRAADRHGKVLPLREHDRRDPHPRRALHLREPEELLPQRRAARVLRHPSHAHRAAPVGAHRRHRRRRRRRARGSRFCHFRIERVDSKERLARIEHEIYSVLKAVFLAVEDFEDMRRVVRGPRPAAARPQAAARGAWTPRAGVPGLAPRRQLHLPRHGEVPAAGATGARPRAGEPPPASSPTPRCCPVVFPGLMERGRGRTSRPATGRPPHRGHRLLQQRDGHLPPGADRRHRDPRVGRRTAALRGDAAPRAGFAMGAFTAEGRGHPAAEGEARLDARRTAGRRRSRTPTARSAPLFNRFPKRELFYADAPSLKESSSASST